MVAPLQRLAISFMAAVLSFAMLAFILARHSPRTITGLLLTLPAPVLVVCFGYLYVRALSRLFPSRGHPIGRLFIPILGTVVLLGCSFWAARWLIMLLQHAV
jgi:Zn-dependent protease with chaperone function